MLHLMPYILKNHVQGGRHGSSCGGPAGTTSARLRNTGGENVQNLLDFYKLARRSRPLIELGRGGEARFG